jgi:hypothetical protein
VLVLPMLRRLRIDQEVGVQSRLRATPPASGKVSYLGGNPYTLSVDATPRLRFVVNGYAGVTRAGSGRLGTIQGSL